MIWQRTLASQMADATGTTVSVRLGAERDPAGATDCEFAASGTTITFPATGRRTSSRPTRAWPPTPSVRRCYRLVVGQSVPVESLTPEGAQPCRRPATPRPAS